MDPDSGFLGSQLGTRSQLGFQKPLTDAVTWGTANLVKRFARGELLTELTGLLPSRLLKTRFSEVFST